MSALTARSRTRLRRFQSPSHRGGGAASIENKSLPYYHFGCQKIQPSAHKDLAARKKIATPHKWTSMSFRGGHLAGGSHVSVSEAGAGSGRIPLESRQIT